MRDVRPVPECVATGAYLPNGSVLCLQRPYMVNLNFKALALLWQEECFKFKKDNPDQVSTTFDIACPVVECDQFRSTLSCKSTFIDGGATCHVLGLIDAILRLPSTTYGQFHWL